MQIIGINRALLFLHVNEFDKCREAVKHLQDEIPDNDALPIIFAATIWQQGKKEKAETLLKKYIEKHPNNLKTKVTLAQLAYEKGNINECIRVLESIEQLQKK